MSQFKILSTITRILIPTTRLCNLFKVRQNVIESINNDIVGNPLLRTTNEYGEKCVPSWEANPEPFNQCLKADIVFDIKFE